PAEMPTEGLSKADKTKLGLIAAVGHHPELLLLDEPTHELDQVIRQEIWRFLKEISRNKNVAVVTSAQVSDDLDRLADTVLMLNKGRAVEYEPAAILKERYGTSRFEEVFSKSTGTVLKASAGNNS